MSDPRSTDSSSRITARVPARLGTLHIGPVLGEGGSGIVYAATRGSERVALKVLREELLLSPRDHTRFLEEADCLRRVSHASIVPLLDAGTLEDGRPYLAMPLLAGETLAERLARGPLPIATALSFFEALADAVTTIHEIGLVHRDIKPENVFLCASPAGAGRPSEQMPMLLDFGIARDVEAGRSTTTEQGGVRGTPAYMAPERFFGAAASTATDIYELAVVFYMMLVGRTPWESEGGAAGRLHPRGPSEFGIILPQAMEDALLKALSTRPEVRPLSASAFAHEVLRAAQASTPTTAPSTVTSNRARTSDPQKGWYRWVMPVAIGSLAAGGALVLVASPKVRAPLVAPAPSESTASVPTSTSVGAGAATAPIASTSAVTLVKEVEPALTGSAPSAAHSVSSGQKKPGPVVVARPVPGTGTPSTDPRSGGVVPSTARFYEDRK